MNILKTIANIKEPSKNGCQSEANDITRRMNRALSNQEYEMLFERSPIGIDILDMNGVIIYCNPAAHEASGYAKEDFIGKHFSKVPTVEKSKVPQHKELLKSIIKGEVLQPFEYAYKHKNGTTGYTEVHCSLLEEAGETTGILVFKKDITESKRAEEMIRESQDKFSKIFRSSPNVVIISRIRDNVILDVNDSFMQITGRPREEVVGKTAAELNFWVKPEQRDRVVQTLQEKGSVSNEECEFHMKSGEIRTGLLSAELSNIGGEPCIIFVASDITERKRAEEALRESEKKYRDLFDNTNELIQSVTTEGRFRYVNNAWREALGYSEEEISELSIFDIIHPDYMEHSLRVFQKLLAGENVGQVSTALVSKDGNKILVEGNVNCKVIDGTPIYTRGIFRDVTKGRYMEEQMLRLSSAVSMSSNCILITDCYAKILDVNEKTLEMYGASNKDELIGRHFLELITPDDRKTANTDVEEIVAKGHLENRDYHMKAKDGREFQVQMSTSLVKDVDGKPMGLVRVGKEINNSH